MSFGQDEKKTCYNTTQTEASFDKSVLRHERWAAGPQLVPKRGNSAVKIDGRKGIMFRRLLEITEVRMSAFQKPLSFQPEAILLWHLACCTIFIRENFPYYLTLITEINRTPWRRAGIDIDDYIDIIDKTWVYL